MNATSRRFSSLDTHTSPQKASSRSSHFEQTGSTHASTDAHGHNDVRCPAAFAFDQCMADEAAACDSIGMSHRDRTTVDVQPVIGDTKLIATIDHLHRECLIQFPQADVGDFLAGLLQQFRYSINRSDAHLIWFASS